MSQLRMHPSWDSRSPGWGQPPRRPQHGDAPARPSRQPPRDEEPTLQLRIGHQPPRRRPRPPIPPGEYPHLRDYDRPNKRTNPGVWLIIAGLVALSASAGAVVGASGKTRDDTLTSAAATPEQTVIAYFDALGGWDCPTAIDLVSDRSWQAGGPFANPEEATAGCTSGALFAQTPALSIQDVQVLSHEGDTAVVAVTGVVDGRHQTLQLRVVQDGGVWKIQLPAAGDTPSDGGAPPPANSGPGTTADPGAPAPTTSTTAPGAAPIDPAGAATVVRDFYDAMVAEDCATLVQLTTPYFWASLVTGSDPADLPGVCARAFAHEFLTSEITVGDIVLDHQEDTTATFSVPLVLDPDGRAYTEYVDAVLEADSWKVNFLY